MLFIIAVVVLNLLIGLLLALAVVRAHGLSLVVFIVNLIFKIILNFILVFVIIIVPGQFEADIVGLLACIALFAGLPGCFFIFFVVLHGEVLLEIFIIFLLSD